MSTIRLGPVAKPQSVYSGQQKPNATAETLTSLNERIIRDPSRIVGWGDFASPSLAYSIPDDTETITAFYIYEYGTDLYAFVIGTDKGRILVSWDRGAAYGVRVDLGAGYQVNDFCAFGGYLYACVSNSGGFLLYRSSDSYTWSLTHTNLIRGSETTNDHQVIRGVD